MTELEMLESEKYWCENCCNWDKEHSLPDGYAKCKLTGTLCFCQERGKECKCFNVPAENVVVPPCKVGQTVYWYDSAIHSKPYPMTVAGIADYGEGHMWVYCKNGTDHRQFRASSFGKTVFLTCEESEAKLKEGVQG